MLLLDPQLTLMDSAQCFHWRRTEHGWAALVEGKPMFVREGGLPQERDYFDLDRDYAAMADRHADIPMVRKMLQALPGLRVLRQPAWEALVAFILSSNNNAVRIRSLVWRVCSLGPQAEVDGFIARGFPDAHTLANAGADTLRAMGCGYRAEYLIGSARMVADGFPLDALAGMEYDEAHAMLRKLPGVGPKVADCVLLFGCRHTCAFPVDVWMERAMAQHFGMDGLSREQIRLRSQQIFGEDAGLIQQYIFHMMRTKQMEA